MDREQYIKTKLESEAQDSQIPRRSWCFHCRRKQETCLCHAIKSFSPKTVISLLMHPKEAKKQRIGTGYLTKTCLKNSRVFSDVNLDENKAFKDFLMDTQYHHVLLYPDSKAWSIDDPKSTELSKALKTPSKKTLVLHLLDATWPCAKKMMRVSSLLKGMQKATFSQKYRSKFIIKHQPHESCLSTLETTYYCLEGLKQQGLEPHLGKKNQYLMDALEALVSFQLHCEHDPDIPSNRGKKPQSKLRLKSSRIRPKKNRLFYWDVERSPGGTKGKIDEN